MEVHALMEKIRIKNIRSLKDTGSVPLAPITLLVGENSSGKSTFLRAFPLIKQSISKKTDGPILWAGDVDDYVDFGSFNETITSGSNKKMEIEFQFKTLLGYRAFRFFGSDDIEKSERSHVHFSITVAANGDKEYVSVLKLKINKTRFQVKFDKNKKAVVLVDNQKIQESNEAPSKVDSQDIDYLWLYRRNDIMRSVFDYALPNFSEMAISSLSPILDLAKNHDLFEDAIALDIIGKALTQGKSLSEIEKNMIPSRSPNKDVEIIRKRIAIFVKKLRTASESDRKKAITDCKLLFLGVNYPTIEEYVEQYFRQVHYIAPLRATAERYYRLRNSAIDEVDYQGKNLAIFLNSLAQDRMNSFQAWTEDRFGFKVTVQKNTGHLSVVISRDGFDGEVNLSDTGFGYSQILPIITQLWELSTRPVTQKSNINTVIPLVVAIEQPELHLHPAMQGRLAKAFIACIDLAKENGYQLQLLLETHSKTMVDYFGRSIARSVLKPSDIAVVLFERDPITGYSTVTKTEFDSTGALNKWPIGFFEPEE